MKFMAVFDGGTRNGQQAVCHADHFKIGMRLPLGAETYVLQDGPAARYFEKTQEECNTLAVRFRLEVESETFNSTS